MSRIVVLDGYTLNPGDLSWEGLEKLGELTVYDRTPVEEIVPRIGDAEYVFVNKVPITRETLEACPNLKFIGVLATGYNIVDVQAARERGVVVTNVPTYGTAAVAQFVFALLLEICHHVGHHSAEVFQGRWTTNPDWCFWDYPLIELAGKTMGIIGFGRIGRAVARLAQAFGMQVVAHNPNLSGVVDGVTMVELDELLGVSDVISLHVPLTPQTQGLINKESIAKMKDGVILINTARGPLIVEEDLKEALDAGKVYAAGLDVVSVEPIQPDNVLLSCKNVFITPHIAWAPKESRQRLMDIAVENLRQFMAGNPINVVNR
ncbi:MAG TPA: D-2-hydroxyacid dehydrogenase [Limnochordia bacterium]|nr:D-2-hydroxyacid dehydrogenase [Limnochordia bacterium]